jgi:hypothetical protein
MITNESKNFDIVTSTGIETVGVKQLTLKEREKLFLSFEETIKNRRRKEYLELSKLMEVKDRNKYLVECANSNKVNDDEIKQETLTDAGLLEIFKVTANKQLNWNEIFKNEDMLIPILKAYYYSFGIDIPDEEEVTPDADKENIKIGEIATGEAQQEANFPIEK